VLLRETLNARFMKNLPYILLLAYVTLFQGSLLAQSTNHFTIIALPDTQHYVDTPANYWHFEAQTQWIVNNRNALNIVFTTHEGDMVEHKTNVTEWETARRIMSTLDKANPAMPYSIAWGNHDAIGAGDSLWETYFGLTSGQNFGVSNFVDYPWWGGNFGLKSPTQNENNYQLFSAGGDNYVVIHLAYMDAPLLAYETTLAAETGDDGTVVNAKARLRWVDSILKAHPNRKAILTTHDFIRFDGMRTASANFIWDQVIIPNPNVFLIMNGHQLGTQAEACRSEFINGRWCHQLLANYQGRQNGGNGWLRILDFSPSEKRIRVKTYSPSLNQYETDSNSQFELVLGNDPGSSSDLIDPLVSLTAPVNGTTISGVAAVASANASDNMGVAGVQFKMDNAYLGVEDATAPYSVTFDTTKFTNGLHTLYARARDAAGNISIASISVTITNGIADTTKPVVSISAPAAGSTVSGTTTISASASDNVAVVGVQFKVDGVNVGAEDATSPFSVSWNSATVVNGSHSVTAIARDAAGNSQTSSAMSVTVNNSVADITPPTVSITAPLSGATISGVISIAASASDNVGVVGVQFKADGINVGGEDMTSPYVVTLNTVTLTNGSHVLTAVARDSAGNTKTSTNVTISVSNLPAAPSSLTANFATATSVNLSWNDNSSNETGFKIERKAGTGAFTQIGSVGVGMTAYADSGLAVGITYTYRVRATNNTGDSMYSNEAIPVESLVIVGALAGGAGHSVAIKDDGTVWAWGDNKYGQLGNGTTNSSLVPTQVLGISGLVEVCCGDEHVLSLNSDGTVWGWGRNSAGQLADGTTATRLVPVRAAGLSNVRTVEAGTQHNLALKADGTMWAWGQNTYGQLGNNTNVTQKTPIQFPVGPVVDIGAGATHTVAVLQDGTVWTCGDNSYGQLGTGTNLSSRVPVKVLGLSNVVKVTVGRRHNFAQKSDGTVWAWGENASGQLGIGINSSASQIPVQVTALGNNTVELASFGAHTLALKADGTLWSWGANTYGQLGNNSLVKSRSPIQVMAGTFVAIHAGYYHSLALKSDGTVWAWGWNVNGQLGNGTTTDQLVPTQVSSLDLIVP
jgi:alpha-tubulin suppressor-like RCC1 family protein